MFAIALAFLVANSPMTYATPIALAVGVPLMLAERANNAPVDVDKACQEYRIYHTSDCPWK